MATAGPAVGLRHHAGEHEDAGADDHADAEDGEVQRRQVPPELVFRLLGVADGVLDGLDPAGAGGHGVPLGRRPRSGVDGGHSAASHGCGAARMPTLQPAPADDAGRRRERSTDDRRPTATARRAGRACRTARRRPCAPAPAGAPRRGRPAPGRRHGRRRLRGLRRRTAAGAGRAARTRCGWPPSGAASSGWGSTSRPRPSSTAIADAVRPAPAGGRGRRLRPPAAQARALRRRASSWC